MKPPILELRLLGAPRVLRAGREVKLARKSVALLAYLATQGPTAREEIASLLWGSFETGNANGNLRRELHRIRETTVRDHCETTGGVLRLKSYSADTDDLAAAGVLLHGLELRDAPEFDAWLEGQRLLRSKGRLEGLRVAAQRSERSDLPQAITLYREIADMEPLSDLDAQQLIRCLIANGQRDQAERAFDGFKRRLSEVGATPALETAQMLLAVGNTPQRNAALLERVGRGKEALEFRLAAADEAIDQRDDEAALEHLALALQFQPKASQRVLLHERRFKLLYKLARFDLLEPEVTLLELASRGDARLEGSASIHRAQLRYWQQDFAGAMISANEALTNPMLSVALQGLASYVVGAAQMKLGKLLEADASMRDAVQRLPTEMVYERIQAHHGLAQLAMQRGSLLKARELNQIAFDLLNDTDERAMRPSVLSLAAVHAMMDEDFERALQLLELAKRECEQTGNSGPLPMVLLNISRAHTQLGDLKASTDALEQALKLIRSGDNRQFEGTLLNNLAINYAQHGQLGMALETGWAAIECARQSGDVRGIAFRSMAHIDLLIQVSDFNSAWQCLAEANSIVESTGLLELVALGHLQKAEILLAQNQPHLALQSLALVEDPSDQETRHGLLYLGACVAERLERRVSAATVETLSKAKTWQSKLLPLQLRLTPSPAVRAAALEALPRATALEELELRLALGLPHAQLLERLTNSLETYPELQRGFLRQLEQRTQLVT